MRASLSSPWHWRGRRRRGAESKSRPKTPKNWALGTSFRPAGDGFGVLPSSTPDAAAHRRNAVGPRQRGAPIDRALHTCGTAAATRANGMAETASPSDPKKWQTRPTLPLVQGAASTRTSRTRCARLQAPGRGRTPPSEWAAAGPSRPRRRAPDKNLEVPPAGGKAGEPHEGQGPPRGTSASA